MTARHIIYLLAALMLGTAIGQARAEGWDVTKMDMAVIGQGSDILSTAGALALGASEVNPIFGGIVAEDPLLGLLLLAGGKYALIRYADSRPYPECVQGRTTSARMGFALGAHNVTSVGAFTAGQSLGIKALSKAAMPLGVLAGVAAWAYSREVSVQSAEAKCSSREIQP